MKILSPHKEIIVYIKKRSIDRKFFKQLQILETNPKHPSLNLKLLEPKKHGIYGFRIDRKYRGLFIYRSDKQIIEVLTITDNYK